MSRADARQWGQHARALRPAGQPAVRATRVTVIVHMGAPAKRGGPPPRRSLSFAVDGGPEMEAAGVELLEDRHRHCYVPITAR